MTQTMASPAGDTTLYPYIDMTARDPMASSLSDTMHPTYVTGEVSRRTSQNTLSPSWATLGARSAATAAHNHDIMAATVAGAGRVVAGTHSIFVLAVPRGLLSRCSYCCSCCCCTLLRTITV